MLSGWILLCVKTDALLAGTVHQNSYVLTVVSGRNLLHLVPEMVIRKGGAANEGGVDYHKWELL